MKWYDVPMRHRDGIRLMLVFVLMQIASQIQ